jgi:hypothetical protein
VQLRKELPLDNGTQTIAYHLARQGLRQVPSVATIQRVLVRRRLVAPQPRKRPRSSWRRFRWPRPNDAWQIDATCWALADGRKAWIMDLLNDHSRVLVAARVAEGPTAKAAWEALAHAVADWGIPARIMRDNGLWFTQSPARAGTWTLNANCARCAFNTCPRAPPGDDELLDLLGALEDVDHCRGRHRRRPQDRDLAACSGLHGRRPRFPAELEERQEDAVQT